MDEMQRQAICEAKVIWEAYRRGDTDPMVQDAVKHGVSPFDEEAFEDFVEDVEITATMGEELLRRSENLRSGKVGSLSEKEFLELLREM